MDGARTELGLDQLEAIDRLADQFECELLAGNRPRIEDYLLRLPGLRVDLLKQLLALEIMLRHSKGESSMAAEYQQRFPQDQDLVVAIMHSLAEKTLAPRPLVGDLDDEGHPQNLGRLPCPQTAGTRRIWGGLPGS